MTGITIHKTRILPPIALLALAFFLFSRHLSGKGPASAFVAPPSQEERLTLYTSMQEEVVSPLVREFENRTGLWVTVKAGGSLSELARISTGEEADWDVILAPGDVLEGYSGLFASAGDLGSVFLSPSQTVFPYIYSDIVIIYNTKLVTLYPPDSWSGLLNPVWNDRIAFFDPQYTGEGLSFLAAISRALSEAEGQEVSPEELLSALPGRCFSDMDEVIRAVADGTCYIGVVSEDAALRAAEAGYDITIVRPREKTSPIPNAMAVLNSSPHQENAGKFLSFLTDETIQSYLKERFFFSSDSEQGASEREARP